MLSSDVRTQQDCNIMYTGLVCLLPPAAESLQTLFSLQKAVQRRSCAPHLSRSADHKRAVIAVWLIGFRQSLGVE